jgi:hypothetical protein
MISPTQVKQVLFVIPAKVGGRAQLASYFGSSAQVTVVETTEKLLVRSEISSRSNSESAAKMPKTNLPAGVVVSMEAP